MSFWDYVIGRDYGASSLGDFVRLMRVGKIAAPAAVGDWKSVEQVLLSFGFKDADSFQLRQVWSDYRRALKPRKTASAIQTGRALS